MRCRKGAFLASTPQRGIYMSEREFSASEALFKIEGIIRSMNLDAVVRYANNQTLVATAELFDDTKNLIESSAGKGPDAVVGALAESIEHLSTLHVSTKDLSSHRCDFIASQVCAKADGILSSLPDKSESIDTVMLTSLDLTQTLFVPHLLLNPTPVVDRLRSANLKFLSRYSSNSGIAFGCSKAEALLHGTHEVIERHILSAFFMAVCGITPAMKLYAPSKSLLAKALRDDPAALALAEKLQIIIIKNQMEVYFSVAFPKSGPGDFHLSAVGSGSSLDISLAVQRAVTEQFQVHTLYDDAQDTIDRKTHDFLARSNKLKPLIDFEPLKNIALPQLGLPITDFTLSVPAQLETLEKNLSANGRSLYCRTVAEYDGGIVSQAYAPGLDRFNIIRTGCMVAPQAVLLQQKTN